jgi:hypothetical protein
MEERRRVTFRFAGDSEVQYVRDLPEAGEFVTHWGEMWVVSRVEVHGVDALVVCEQQRSSHVRGVAGAGREGSPSGGTL